MASTPFPFNFSMRSFRSIFKVLVRRVRGGDLIIERADPEGLFDTHLLHPSLNQPEGMGLDDRNMEGRIFTRSPDKGFPLFAGGWSEEWH